MVIFPYALLSRDLISLLISIFQFDDKQCGSWSPCFTRSQQIWIHTIDILNVMRTDAFILTNKLFILVTLSETQYTFYITCFKEGLILSLSEMILSKSTMND